MEEPINIELYSNVDERQGMLVASWPSRPQVLS